MFNVTNNLQANIMSKDNEGTFPLNCGVERFHREFTVVTVTYFLTRRGNLKTVDNIRIFHPLPKTFPIVFMTINYLTIKNFFGW